MDEERTRYINSRRGCPGSPCSRGPAPPPPEATPSSAPGPKGHGALDAQPTHTAEAGAGQQGARAPAEGLWLSGFQPREKAERLRNCAALPREFVDQVVLQVAHLLLGRRSPADGSVQAWNRGGNRQPQLPPGARQELLPSSLLQTECETICTCVHLLSRSAMSDSLQPHGLWPARLFCPWDSPGKDTRGGCPSPRGLPDPGIEPTCPALLLLLSHFSRVRLCATP